MDNSATGWRPDLFEVVRETLHTFPGGGPAHIEPLRFPPQVPTCQVVSPIEIRDRLHDFIAACGPASDSKLTLGASGCWPGKRVTVVRFTLATAGRDSKSPASWSFHVPLTAACESAAKAAARCPSLSRARRVLVVDDEPVSRRLTTGLLNTLGCETIVVDNGTTAIQLAARENFDVIFMDCDMPCLSGYETTAGIRNLEKTYTPIVAVTATIPDGWAARTKCLQAGMDDYLPKPVTAAALKGALEWWAPGIESPAS